jgi:hypothetical protein
LKSEVVIILKRAFRFINGTKKVLELPLKVKLTLGKKRAEQLVPILPERE